MVEKANTTIEIERKKELLKGKLENASLVYASIGAFLYRLGKWSILLTITKPVIKQSTTVSQKVPVIDTSA